MEANRPVQELVQEFSVVPQAVLLYRRLARHISLARTGLFFPGLLHGNRPHASTPGASVAYVALG
jgi:hypothetical protein